MSVLCRDQGSCGNPSAASPVLRSAATVKSQLPFALWQSSVARVSRWLAVVEGYQ
jgi:hypothetical protein